MISSPQYGAGLVLPVKKLFYEVEENGKDPYIIFVVSVI